MCVVASTLYPIPSLKNVTTCVLVTASFAYVLHLCMHGMNGTSGQTRVWCVTHVQVMARPQNLPYTRQDVLRAFQMFSKPGDPPGHIHPDVLEQALVSNMQGGVFNMESTYEAAVDPTGMSAQQAASRTTHCEALA